MMSIFSKSKSNFSFALQITFLFFFITCITTPWSLYPFVGNIEKNSLLYPTERTSIIPESEIYTKAAQSLIPWVTVSPWAPILVQGEQRCESFGCFFQLLIWTAEAILLFIVYFIFVYSLLKAISTGNRKRKYALLIILFIIWTGFVSVGVTRINKYYIDPPRLLNSFLRQLAAVSHKNPFPDGTRALDFAYPNNFYFKNEDLDLPSGSDKKTASMIMNLYYTNPHNGKERYNIFVVFGATIPSISCSNSYDSQPNAREVVPGVWRCDGIWTTATLFMPPFKKGERVPYKKFMRFLDEKHTVFVWTELITPVDGVEAPDPIPTFFAYYQ